MSDSSDDKSERQIVAHVKVAKRVSIWGEWVVLAYDQHGKRFPEADYFTTDREDAERTAVEMINPMEVKR